MEGSTGAALSASARRVQDALAALGLDCVITEHAASARTSQEAADLLGCTVGQIAKSLVFRGTSTGDPVLVIASGANRVDEAKVGALLGEPIGRAKPEFVREVTGYAIGGIPPVGHARSIRTFVDADLLAFDVVFAAGGTPNALFPIKPADLLRVCGNVKADVKN
ncbi:prolyl-tRNA editing protein [Betaproteobacteria bacterium GR16-43]|nr:prolyl-tRNA editing protein [Betaproteobacteria bacterium GR16-43]